MKGFDNKFKDFPDYILGITQEIWEQRGVATLHHYYAKNLPFRTPGAMGIGNQHVIAATLATLSEFPDRQLFGEDVIWSGTPEDGMLSSHRILTTATHLGDGVYGKASGKTLKYRVIADCHAKNNQIDDEWLIRDQGAVVRQLGIDPKEYAADLITQEGGPDHCVQPFTPTLDVPGPYKGKGNEEEFGQKYADILRRIMGAEISCIKAEYDRACQVEYPGGVSSHSWDAVERFWMGLLASFPNAKLTIDHQIGRQDPLMPPRAALRFSLQGKHDGWGSFGKPTGADVYIMAAAHAEFGPHGLRREFVVFDETSIWKQILMQTG